MLIYNIVMFIQVKKISLHENSYNTEILKSLKKL